MNVVKILDEVQYTRHYLTLETKYSDEVNSDFTKHTWYLSRLLDGKGLKNIQSIKIYAFSLRRVVGNIARARITIAFDEFIESFKHNDREFQFLGVNAIPNGNSFFGEQYTKFNFPFNSGGFVFNQPIKYLDKLTMSVADPFEPIEMSGYVTVYNATIIHQYGPGYTTVFSDEIKKFRPTMAIISGLTSTDPADDSLIAHFNRTEGFFIPNPDYGQFGIYVGNRNLIGILSSFTLTIKRDDIAVNLEIICRKSHDNSSVSDNRLLISSIRRPTKLIIDRLFYKYQPKRIYLALDTQLAAENSYNSIKWNIKVFSQQLQSYATASDSIKNIIGMKCGPLIKVYTLSIDIYDTDVYYVYIRETNSQCFRNDHIRYNFVFEKKRIQTVDRYELSPFECNDGYCRFNKPIDDLSTVTLDSYQKILSFGQESFVGRSIITNSFDLYFIGGPPLQIVLQQSYFNAVVGDRVIIQGFKNLSSEQFASAVPATFIYGNFSQELINEINRPDGFKITNITGSNTTFELDSNISIDMLYYATYANAEAPKITFVSSISTIVPVEFVCVDK